MMEDKRQCRVVLAVNRVPYSWLFGIYTGAAASEVEFSKMKWLTCVCI